MNRKMGLHIILLCVVALHAMLSGCAPFTQADRSLITNIPCAPPCWQGITPGETARERAIETLRTISFVQTDSIREHETSVSWSFVGLQRGGLLKTQHDIVVLVQVNPIRGTVRLGDLVRAQGEPDTFVFFSMM